MKKQMLEDEPLLIQALKNGCSEAFDRIYHLYAKRLYAYSLQFTKSPEDSEEIVQDVFVRLWINRAAIRQEETLSSLLFIMAKNYLINAFRKKVNQPVYEEYIIYKNELFVEDALYKLEHEEFVKRFHRALATLPVTQKNVITLAKIEQLTNKEIAIKLSLSEQTVKNQLSIGLKKLKEKLNVFWTIMLLVFN